MIAEQIALFTLQQFQRITNLCFQCYQKLREDKEKNFYLRRCLYFPNSAAKKSLRERMNEMTLVISKQPERHKQISILDLYNPNFSLDSLPHYNNDPTSTLCRSTNYPWRILSQDERMRFFCLANDLYKFSETYSDLINDDMNKYYYTFFIPKRNGKKRRIDAPQGK